MAELGAAQRHVSEALQRLETALARRLAGASNAGLEGGLENRNGERDTLAHDVASLRNECDRLNAALHAVEEENRAMREITETVARRLDGPISELDRMLEG